MNNTQIQSVIAESARRRDEILHAAYHPDTGLGCSGERRKVNIAGGILHLPVNMTLDPRFSPDMPEEKMKRLRHEYDFEYWAYTNIMIKDKSGWGLIPFTLNRAQRRLLAILEQQRLAEQPIRAIVLKARQMGCSTFVQIYFMWIQMCLRTFCNSIICAQSKDTSLIIKDIYSRALANYPKELTGDKPIKLAGITGASNLFRLASRDCTMTVASANFSDNTRGADIALAHLSEVAHWRDTPKHHASATVQAVCASIMMMPLTAVVMESTANGVGNLFHSEWVRAAANRSDKTALFVPWHLIDIYRKEPPDAQAFWKEMDEYEHNLWQQGLSLDQIYWYHRKRLELGNDTLMRAEYPSNDIEAFSSVSNAVFSHKALEELRKECMPPAAVGELAGSASTGEDSLIDIHFTPDPKGKLQVWEMPDRSPASEIAKRYLISVDIGGRSDESDFSVIAVFDRADSAHISLVAQWRGHCDHDLLAWYAARMARWYANATLIIESNTVETDRTEGDHGEYILHEISRHCRNLYKRADGRPGFHTNRASKTHIINDMIGIVRQMGYTERDDNTINEALAYERKQNGSFGARDGHHDDCVITRALALSHAKEMHLKALRSAAAMKGWKNIN